MVKVNAPDSECYWLEPPFTEEEKRWREHYYSDDTAPPGYDPETVILMSPDEELEYWIERSKTPETGMTFYGGAPHRPNPHPVKKPAADTE